MKQIDIMGNSRLLQNMSVTEEIIKKFISDIVKQKEEIISSLFWNKTGEYLNKYNTHRIKCVIYESTRIETYFIDETPAIEFYPVDFKTGTSPIRDYSENNFKIKANLNYRFLTT